MRGVSFATSSRRVGDSALQFLRAEEHGLSLDPNDRGMLDVVGFDTSAPAVIADFIRN